MTRIIKILDLVPVVYTEDLRLSMDDRRRLAVDVSNETGGLVRLDVVTVNKGPASIESVYDEYVSAPYILEKVKWAEESGYDAVVIDCFGDPALDAARELVKIPVIGPNQASCLIAVQLAQRFSIVTTLPEAEPALRALIAKYGLTQHLASIEVVNIPVLELGKDPEKLVNSIVEAGKRAYYAHYAKALILGCTGMSFVANKVEERLLEEKIEIPVIEPLRAAVYTAVSLVLFGKSHSKATYRLPRQKLRVADFKTI
ncbi:MAG: aspartate/glutamate racemase family protein [Desulfurococcaceae archaeon]